MREYLEAIGAAEYDLLQIIQKKTKKKWLLEWGLLIAMAAGMCCGLII